MLGYSSVRPGPSFFIFFVFYIIFIYSDYFCNLLNTDTHTHIFLDVIICHQFFKPFFYVVLCLFGWCVSVCLLVGVCSPSDCSGEHHEGEDAKERREVVVLLARQKQRQQSGKFVRKKTRATRRERN